MTAPPRLAWSSPLPSVNRVVPFSPCSSTDRTARTDPLPRPSRGATTMKLEEMDMTDDRQRSDSSMDPTDDPSAHPADPGAYVGNRPERQAESIPGGVLPEDDRIAAHSTQAEPLSDDSADDPDRREAGQSR
jgi:hypothetical protein